MKWLFLALVPLVIAVLVVAWAPWRTGVESSRCFELRAYVQSLRDERVNQESPHPVRSWVYTDQMPACGI